jgi:hypothetical protein
VARYLSSSALIESAKVRGMIPSTQVTFTDEDLLRFANEEMDTALVPYVMSFHEDYFLFPEDIPLETNIIAYPIPYRAVGNKLRDVSYKDPGNALSEMTRILVEDLPFYQGGGSVATNAGLRVFSIQNNEIVLSTSDIQFSIQGYLSTFYYIRPNQLVTEDRACIIQAIDRVTGQITVDNLPNIYTSASLVDFIQIKSPNKCYSIDNAITNVDSTNKIFTFALADIPTRLAVGDYICLAEECIIPQIPIDLHPMLAQRIACRCLESLGDQAGLAAANTKLGEMELKLGTVIDNRVEGAPLKVTNRHSFLRSSRNYYRR